MNLIDVSASIKENGFAVLRGAISKRKAENVRGMIDDSIADMDKDRHSLYQDTSYCPELRATPEITSLYTDSICKTSVANLLEFTPEDPKRGQIALRFKESGPLHLPRPHIDGFPYGNNVIPRDSISPFLFLVGIFLSDVTEEFHGNFTVFPATHKLNHQKYLLEGLGGFPGGSSEIGSTPPVQICAEAGDAIICHYYLGHAPAINVSPKTRYAVFFRIGKAEGRIHQAEIMKNLWFGWRV